MPQECWDLLHGASTPPPQAPRIAGTSGGCGAGERERGEPTLQECRAPQKAPNEADPRRVVRFSTTLATIRSTRSRRQARATGELGAANVVLSFEQFLRIGDLVRGWHGPSLGLAVLFAP
jgi:hypothetical protein